MGNCCSEQVDFDGDVDLYHFDLHRAVGKGAFGKVRSQPHPPPPHLSPDAMATTVALKRTGAKVGFPIIFAKPSCMLTYRPEPDASRWVSNSRPYMREGSDHRS